jgi:hypothetical protein
MPAKILQRIGVLITDHDSKPPVLHIFSSMIKAQEFYDFAKGKAKISGGKPQWIGEMKVKEYT